MWQITQHVQSSTYENYAIDIHAVTNTGITTWMWLGEVHYSIQCRELHLKNQCFFLTHLTRFLKCTVPKDGSQSGNTQITKRIRNLIYLVFYQAVHLWHCVFCCWSFPSQFCTYSNCKKIHCCSNYRKAHSGYRLSGTSEFSALFCFFLPPTSLILLGNPAAVIAAMQISATRDGLEPESVEKCLVVTERQGSPQFWMESHYNYKDLHAHTGSSPNLKGVQTPV